VSPATGGDISALLNATDVRGDRVGATVEGRVIPDLAVRGGDVPHSLVPLPAQHRGSFDAAATSALRAIARAAHVLEARFCVDERSDVGVPPPGGRGADEDPPQHR
jgi:hypothetical protein